MNKQSVIKLLFMPIRKWIWYIRRQYPRIKEQRKNPVVWIDKEYFRMFKKNIDWEHPRDLNQIIQWLKIYSDTSRWSLYADKYRVREYVKSCGLEDLLVPLYGKWDHIWQIKWQDLPNQFVMKVNNGSGDVRICYDKNQINRLEWKAYFFMLLHEKYGYACYQPHYDKIKPCIIAEKLLDINKQAIKSTSLIDYKVWCFYGTPKYIWVVANRNHDNCEVDMYDVDWNHRSEMCLETNQYLRMHQTMPKPKNLQKMLDAATKLSKDCSLVRVDFYEVDGKLYFGEMTMTSAGGFMDFFTDCALQEMAEIYYNKK